MVDPEGAEKLDGEDPVGWSKIDLCADLDRIGLEHGRPDLGLEVKVERATIHPPALVWKPSAPILRFGVVPRMMWLESFEYSAKALKVLRRL